jgi:transposase
MKDIGNKTSQYLLGLCCTPEGIMAQGVPALAVILKKISRGNIGRERAEELCKAAQESVGIREGQKSMALEVAAIVAALVEADRFIARLEGEMDKYLGEIPYSQSILSIKGIGTIITSGLIGEIGDFGQFSTIGELMKLAGLDLYELSSGQHKGKKRISKRGRHLLRKLLFYAAIGAVRKDGIMYECYQGYIKRGMLRMKAMIAITRKLLRVIFAIVREQSTFVNNYSEIQFQMKAAA